MKLQLIAEFWIWTGMMAALHVACASTHNQEANSPEASDTLCRVTIQSWKGTAVAEVRGQKSDVQGLFGSSTAVLVGGTSVVIKGWLGDVTVGHLEGKRFVLTMWGKDFPSDPYVSGETAFTWNSVVGPDTEPIHSENCTDDELGLGGAHLMALALQSHTSRPNK